jgi:hypothetical protein
MCISLVLYDSHPALLLLLAFNRDEFWDRQAPLVCDTKPHVFTSLLACLQQPERKQGSVRHAFLPSAAATAECWCHQKHQHFHKPQLPPTAT